MEIVINLNGLLVTESSSIEEKCLKNLEAEYSKLREGVHISDLTLCLRQSLYRKINPKPLTQTELKYYLTGAEAHGALQKLYGSDAVREEEVMIEGVLGHIDILDVDTPIEYKTTRSNLAEKRISDHWIRQLVYYMLALDCNSGILQINLLNAKKGGQNNFPAYRITFQNAQQKEIWRKDFHERAERFKTALELKDASLAPIERGEGNWLCSNCKYREECDVIENAEYRYDVYEDKTGEMMRD